LHDQDGTAARLTDRARCSRPHRGCRADSSSGLEPNAGRHDRWTESCDAGTRRSNGGSRAERDRGAVE